MSNLSNLKDAQLVNVAKGLGIATEDAEGKPLPRADILAAVEANNAGKAPAAAKATKATKAPAKAAKAEKATKAPKEPKAPRAKVDPNAPATDPEHKVCKTCNTDKPINSFPTTAPRADGRRRGDECRACRDARVNAGKPAKAEKATKAPTKATKETAPAA